MISIFCRQKHSQPTNLCWSCQALLDYARERLDRCCFREKKPACADCPVHCYEPKRRREVVDVMRFAGPQMMFYHPILVLAHFFHPKPKRK